MPGAKCAMWFAYLDQRAFESIDRDTVGFGPVPKGPDGLRGSEYNCMMHGLYAGNVDRDKPRRDLAWDYTWFYGGEEANAIYARTFVENGLGRFVRPSLLRRAGYPDEAEAVPEGWEDAYAAALEHGIPEPYGRNCQLVYTYMSRGIDQILNDYSVKRMLRNGDDLDGVRGRVREILNYRVANANQKMLGKLPDDVRRFRRRVAGVVVVAIAIAFTLVFRRVFRLFKGLIPKEEVAERHPLRAGLAYLMMLPALATIAIWSYWPLIRGTFMAFQDYNVRGFTKWVGLENFAMVLFSPDFWHAIGVSLKYTLLYMTFGFGAPIILALLLSDGTGFSILLPGAWKEKLAKLPDGPATLGLRPEDVVCLDTGDSSACHFDAAVDVVEPMGAETCVYASIGGTSFISRTDGKMRVEPDQHQRFRLRLEAAHCFAPSGEAMV